jgi:hypothetical protein
VVQLRRVGVEFAFELRQSPKMALRPALLGLKRAAEAKKCQRIAGRVTALAGGKPAGAFAGARHVRDGGLERQRDRAWSRALAAPPSANPGRTGYLL